MKYNKAGLVMVAVSRAARHKDAPTTRDIHEFRCRVQGTLDHYNTTYRWLEHLCTANLLVCGHDGKNNVYQISQRGRKFLNAWEKLSL